MLTADGETARTDHVTAAWSVGRSVGRSAGQHGSAGEQDLQARKQTDQQASKQAESTSLSPIFELGVPPPLTINRLDSLIQADGPRDGLKDRPTDGQASRHTGGKAADFFNSAHRRSRPRRRRRRRCRCRFLAHSYARSLPHGERSSESGGRVHHFHAQRGLTERLATAWPENEQEKKAAEIHVAIKLLGQHASPDGVSRRATPPRYAAANGITSKAGPRTDRAT